MKIADAQQDTQEALHSKPPCVACMPKTTVKSACAGSCTLYSLELAPNLNTAPLLSSLASFALIQTSLRLVPCAAR